MIEPNTELKIYVWEDFFPDWSEGLAVAIADSEDQAKQLIAEKYGYPLDGDWGKCKVYEITKPIVFAIPGGS